MHAQMINTITPKGYTLVNNNVLRHPDNPRVMGALHRIDATGVYVLLSAGTSNSCPQDWAEQHDATRA